MVAQERLGRRQQAGKDPLARGLGWFSIALGTAQITAPKGLARLIGLRGGPDQGRVMRIMGIREIAQGVGILTRPRPTGWLWSRVAGDAIDLALLLKADKRDADRAAAAVASVVGVTVPDVIESARMTQARDVAPDVVVQKSITVNKPRSEVYGFWRRPENFPRFMIHLESVEDRGNGRSHWVAKGPLRKVEWDAEIVEQRPDELIAWRSLEGSSVRNSGFVRFAEAPGGHGTEVIVELHYTPPAGDLGLAVAKLMGEEPETQLTDDLRRFKQVIETGEVIRSDGAPHGHWVVEHVKQRPAQPLGDRR